MSLLTNLKTSNSYLREKQFIKTLNNIISNPSDKKTSQFFKGYNKRRSYRITAKNDHIKLPFEEMHRYKMILGRYKVDIQNGLYCSKINDGDKLKTYYSFRASKKFNDKYLRKSFDLLNKKSTKEYIKARLELSKQKNNMINTLYKSNIITEQNEDETRYEDMPSNMQLNNFLEEEERMKNLRGIDRRKTCYRRMSKISNIFFLQTNINSIFNSIDKKNKNYINRSKIKTLKELNINKKFKSFSNNKNIPKDNNIFRNNVIQENKTYNNYNNIRRRFINKAKNLEHEKNGAFNNVELKQVFTKSPSGIHMNKHRKNYWDSIKIANSEIKTFNSSNQYEQNTCESLYDDEDNSNNKNSNDNKNKEKYLDNKLLNNEKKDKTIEKFEEIYDNLEIENYLDSKDEYKFMFLDKLKSEFNFFKINEDYKNQHAREKLRKVFKPIKNHEYFKDNILKKNENINKILNSNVYKGLPKINKSIGKMFIESWENEK